MRTRTFVCAGAILFLFHSHVPAAGEGWTDDFEGAKARAKKEGKHLLLDFTGSDWCGWCIRLHGEVFSKEVFKKEAPKHFVLVELDFPRQKQLPAKIAGQNEELARRFGIQGFPTIILADAKARAYGRTGYRPGGAESYVKHLEELRANKVGADKLFAKADKAEGLEKARLLDKALEKLEQNGVVDSREDVIASIKKLDHENKGGLKVKYELREKLAEVSATAQGGDFDGALKVIEDTVKEYSPEGKSKQELFFWKSLVLHNKNDAKGRDEALEVARKAAPDSDRAKQISEIIKSLKDS